MPIKPFIKYTEKSTPKEWWKHLKGNEICPGCGRVIHNTDKDIEASKTKRDTFVFFHTKCLEGVWK